MDTLREFAWLLRKEEPSAKAILQILTSVGMVWRWTISYAEVEDGFGFCCIRDIPQVQNDYKLYPRKIF